MVYSASSARTLLQGHGDGTGYLVRYVTYGGVGLVVMHVCRARGVDAAAPVHAAAAARLLRAAASRCRSRASASPSTARARWLGAGPLQFQPSELMKLALVLYAAQFLASGPRRDPALTAA